MIKKLSLLLSAVAVLFVSVYFYLCFVNNWHINDVDSAKLVDSRERAVLWVVDNKEKILKTNNPMLWWMVKRSAELSADPRLFAVYETYKRRYYDSAAMAVWRPLFTASEVVDIDPLMLLRLPDYNQYFIYGFTCDKNLEKTAIIQQQFSTGFCPDHHPISPACVTHQLMALRFRQERGCGNAEEISRQVTQLQDMIVEQLIWDPRIVDVYLQRVMMLVDTGAEHRVKKQWLQKILDQQQGDGGWGGFQSLVPLFNDKAIGFSSRGFSISAEKSNFHTTAQGLLIMSLLSQQ